MEKKAMLIRSGESFMVNVITQKLEEAGYDVLPADITVAAVNAQQKETDILVFSDQRKYRAERHGKSGQRKRKIAAVLNDKESADQESYNGGNRDELYQQV